MIKTVNCVVCAERYNATYKKLHIWLVFTRCWEMPFVYGGGTQRLYWNTRLLTHCENQNSGNLLSETLILRLGREHSRLRRIVALFICNGAKRLMHYY